MLLVTTALSGLMAGLIQTAPAPPPQQPQQPVRPAPAAEAEPAPTGEPRSRSLRTRRRHHHRRPCPRWRQLRHPARRHPDRGTDTAAYGASNIAELLTYLEPLTRSSRGRADGQPVLLVNGRRISGFREIQGMPSEAIERIDILPEEVALEYGYAPTSAS